jgi:CheY-like chemotaxis protein
MINKAKTCLLVEDDPEDQEFFMETLQSVSSRTGCYAVSNGEEALLTLTEERLKPDYIFTDMQMPKMNGFEFLKRLRALKEYRNTPVIIYSSSYCEDQFKVMKQLGAIAFYSKTRFNMLQHILRKYFSEPKSISLS